MKIVAVIPARYGSTRFPGKPLADICGKPMIWWVCNQVGKVKEFDSIYVATDDNKIKNCCESYGINVLMTSSDHPNHISRVHEVSTMVASDHYVCINGDEPLIEPNIIKSIINPLKENSEIFALNLMTTIRDTTQLVDFAKIKIVTDSKGCGLYMSRSPIPYPRGSSEFEFKKYVGVECMSKDALDFFVNTPPSRLELIEDIDHLRFIENGKSIQFIDVESDTLSVDTPKDLEKVISMVKGIQNGDKS